MKNILIHHNFKSETLKTKEHLIDLLTRESIHIVAEQPDLVVSIGGDGTMLNAIRKHIGEDVPFIGINTGSLGFLPTISSKRLTDFIDVIKNSMYTITKFPLLTVTVETVKGKTLTCYAFNEIVIKQADPRLMKASITFDDQLFNRFTGDGLIVSTPIGTTGYAIWAGGAAVHPEVSGIQLIPINANDNAINHPIKTPIIIPEKTRIAIDIERPMYSAVVVGCDGVKVSRYAAATIRVQLHHKPIRILRCHPFNYFELFTEKILHKNNRDDHDI